MDVREEELEEQIERLEDELDEVRSELDSLRTAVEGVLVELAMASNGDTRYFATFDDVHRNLKEILDS